MTITEYFDNKVRDAYLYTNYRVIPGIDGLKNTQRKCIYVMQKSNGSYDKISNLASIIARDTEYLHGNVSMESVLSGLNIAFDGCGNNLPILKGKGQFGSKFNPDAIGASRYVYTKKADIFDLIYKKEDIPVYNQVFFEGKQIEPSLLLPTLIPIYNAIYAIGNGFASSILPRRVENIIAYLESALKGKTPNRELLEPYINGYDGTIQKLENGGYAFIGKFTKLARNKIEITEIKPYCSLEDYLKHLDKLVENKIIKDYKDESINDKFKFILSVGSSFYDSNDTDDKIISTLGLKEVLHENIVMFNENNKIVSYKDIVEYTESFIKWRLDKYALRKQKMLGKLQSELDILLEKQNFISAVLAKECKVIGQSKKEVQAFLADRGYKHPDSLLGIPLYNLTKEELEKLDLKIKNLKEEVNTLQATETSTLWLNDLQQIKKAIKQ